MSGQDTPRLDHARALIRTGNVAAARRVLRKLRHQPAARQLLDHLAEIAPPPRRRRMPRSVYVLVLTCLLLTVPFFLGLGWGGPDAPPEATGTLPLPSSPLATAVSPRGPTSDPTTIWTQATRAAETQSAAQRAAAATVTRQAALDATATLRASLHTD